MTKLRFSLAFSLHYMNAVLAIALALSPQIRSPNQTLPILLLPNANNHLNITTPLPPYAFSTQFSFDKAIPLKPLEVYICAIELMSFLSNLPWTFSLTSTTIVSGSLASTEVSLSPFPPPPYTDGRLQTQHGVWGLYEVSLKLAQGNHFYEADAGIYLGEDELGWLTFRPKTVPETTNHSLALTLDSVNTTALTANSGSFIDPDDKNFVITFFWDEVRIKAQDFFTVFLDAFAIAAPHDNDNLKAGISAARSASGDTVMSTWTDGPGPSDQMSWARLKRVLLLLWHCLVIGKQGVVKPRFEGLEFGIEFKGKLIGRGRILRLDGSGESVGGSAVEK